MSTTPSTTKTDETDETIENDGLPPSKYPYLTIIVTVVLLIVTVGLTFVTSRGLITIIGLQNNPLRFIIYGIILFAFLILSGIAYMIYYISINKTEIQKNWASYRCRPYIIPFVGILKSLGVAPSNVATSDNYVQCSHSIFESMFEIAMTPFIAIIGKQNNVLTGIIDDMNQSRKVIYYIRENIKNTNRDIFMRLYETYSRLSALFNVVKKYIYLIIKLFSDLFGVLIFSAATMGSIWNGPIMGVARFFCFPGETYINMADGEYKMIKKINIGDILQDGATVIGWHKVSGNGMNMYNYSNYSNNIVYDIIHDGPISHIYPNEYIHGIYPNEYVHGIYPNEYIHVSGTHLVYENNMPIRVEDSMYATKIENIYEYVYCLETTTSKIHINNVIFADYSETNDTNVNNMIQSIILEHLNQYKQINQINQLNQLNQ